MRSHASRVVWAIALTVASLAVAGRRASAQVSETQLNENCTISVLNRNVRVRPDGSWVLPNVPANFGFVRARVTCIVDGRTISGESDPFLIPANGVVNHPHITFGATTPIPRTVVVTTATPTLTALGADAQLAVMASYSDGTSRDVTSSSGTQYTISNPAIATVSSAGVVRAVKAGTVVIQATLEGASGMASVRIAPAGVDTDGDGIPDDYEIAHGLNPNNPIDAQEDPDHDGLTNLQEYLLGTDPLDADTDRDGLSDGREVNVTHTNPLLWDTDGDGISDGLEDIAGTNPLDGSKFNIPAALTAVHAAPQAFVLTYNTIEPSASVRLTVTGTMLDGRTIDVTARGVNYVSSDLAICNFGATPGQVFAGQSGSCTVGATIGAFSDTTAGTIRSFTPTALSFVNIPGFANSVDVAGDVAYVAAGSAGLQVIDVSDRANPRLMASAALALPGNANDVKLDGTRAYVAAGSAGLHIIDVSKPMSPQLIGSVDTPGDAYDVRASGNLAYVADGPAGLQVVEVSSPDHPKIVGTVLMPLVFGSRAVAHGVAVNGSLAVIAAGSAGLQTVDVTNPAKPVLLGGAGVPDFNDAKDVAIAGTTAYLADYTGSLRVVDVSHPAAPVIVGSTDGTLGGYLMDVGVAPPFVFGADVFFRNGVPIVDVSVPNTPIARTRLDFLSPFRDDNGTGIAVDGTYLYLTASRGIVENGTSEDTGLYIGQYRALEDAKGVAPTVAIESPAEGATFIEGETIPIRAAATDDVAVVSVTFLVDGTTAFTDTSAPYQFSVTAPTGVGTLTVAANALDLGANVGTASAHVNVIPDPGTTVIGRVVGRDNQPLGGVHVSVLGRSGTTGVDGTFSVSGVPTLRPTITVAATLSSNGTILAGGSAATPPVRDGTTDVGDIVVAATTFETDLGTLIPRCDYCTVPITFPPSFAFPIGPNTYTRVYANNGYLFTDKSDYLEAFCCDLTTTGAPVGAGFYVNDQLPGKVVLTWYRQFTFRTGTQLNSIQIVLFADGRIQYGYNGIASGPNATVGLFPSTYSTGRQIDFSTTETVSIGPNEYVYENFVPFSNRFDLDNGFVIFTPAGGGGYELHPIPDVVAPVCSIVTPADGSTLFGGEALSITASATDNGGVSHVAFSSSAGGVAVDVNAAPFATPYVVPVGVTQITFTATAFDGWRNSTACTSTVSVVPGPPPTVTIVSPAAGTALTAGATIPITIDATNRVPVSSVDLFVNGLKLSTDAESPFALLFTVPAGVSTLSLSTSATDTVGKIGVSATSDVTVQPDAKTTVRGTIVDASNADAPIAGAAVVASVHGVSAEVFNFDTSLTALPDLAGATPNLVSVVSALNLRNPGSAFGADPFGLVASASRAIRFSAALRITAPGDYTFTLGVNEGGRLIVNGTTVVELPSGVGHFQEASGAITLASGSAAIQVLTFDNTTPEVQLSYAPSGRVPAVIPPNQLSPTLVPYQTTSGADGTFSLAPVPTAFGSLAVSATATIAGRPAHRVSDAVAPVPGGVTNVGVVRLADFGALYAAAFNGSNGPASLYAVDPDTGVTTLIGPIGFWRVSAMDVTGTGTIYAVGRDPATGKNVLLTIDAATGHGTQIGPTGVESLGFGDTIADIAFRASDGVLFAYLEAGDGLGTIDLTSGAATAIGSTRVNCCGNGMAFAPDGRLLHANEDALHVLDQTTGVATVLVPLTYPALSFPRIASMKFQPDTGVLFGYMKTNNSNGTYLVKIDIVTGAVTIVGARALDGLDAVTWGPRR